MVGRPCMWLSLRMQRNLFRQLAQKSLAGYRLMQLEAHGRASGKRLEKRTNRIWQNIEGANELQLLRYQPDSRRTRYTAYDFIAS